MLIFPFLFIWKYITLIKVFIRKIIFVLSAIIALTSLVISQINNDKLYKAYERQYVGLYNDMENEKGIMYIYFRIFNDILDDVYDIIKWYRIFK